MQKLSTTVSYQERVLPSLGFYAATLFLPIATFLVTLPFSDEFGIVIASISMMAVLLAHWFMAPRITLTADYLSVGLVKVGREFLGTAQ